MILIGIPEIGRPEPRFHANAEILEGVIDAMHDVYRTKGYNPPWIGYIAIDDGHAIGTCAFKNPPEGGRVEISYFTFPEYEGMGVATKMAERLVAIARCECPEIILTAQTLTKKDASTTILEKLGFIQMGEYDHPEDGKVWHWHLEGTWRIDE